MRENAVLAQLVGYDCLGASIQAELLNDLYAKEWNPFRNFFCPGMKHLCRSNFDAGCEHTPVYLHDVWGRGAGVAK